MMAKSLKMPKCVQFNKCIWNSEPFTEHFLYDLKARKYYLLDESDCRTSLINLFSLFDFWTLQTENQMSLRTVLSPLCTMLAVNIRDSESVPLVDTFNEEEFASDANMNRRLEKPISKWNQVSEEIQNALRSVERFDVVAPALAWAIVRFFVGEIPINKTVELELDRWKRFDTSVQFPRGCVAFLERKLRLVKNFSFLAVDLATLVKATAVFFKIISAEHSKGPTALMRENLIQLTRCFIEKKLGPWISVEEIARGNLFRQMALIESLQKVNDDPRLKQAVENLSSFYSNLAKRFDGFALGSHHVYSVYSSRTLSYFSNSQIHNSELLEKIQTVKDVLSTLRSIEDLDACDADDETASIESNARQIAKSYLMRLPPEQRMDCRRLSVESSADLELEALARDVKRVAKKNKKRRRKRV